MITPSEQAALTGSPVEILADRTQTSSTFAMPDGTLEARYSAGSVNYQDLSGAWQPIDDTLVADPNQGYAWENSANRYRVELPSTLAAAPVKVSLGADWVGFALSGASGSLSSAGDSATYTNALPGVNVQYQAQPDAVKETLVLASAAAPSSYSFAVTASSGVSLSADGNQISVSDGQTAIGVLPAPSVTDAAGASGSASMALATTDTGWTVTVTPDAAWLAAAGRQFPVRVDPSVIVSPSAVCWVDSFQPTIHECSGGSDLLVGSPLQGSTLYPQHGLVDMAIPSSVPYDAVVGRATLTANVESSYGTNSLLLAILDEDWNAGQTTWNQSSTGVNWGVPGGFYSAGYYQGTGYTSATVPAAGGSVTWSITQMVQDWLNDEGGSFPAAGNLGFALAQTNESTVGSYQLGSFSLKVDYVSRRGPNGSAHVSNLRLNDKATLGVQVANDNAVLSNSDLSVAGAGENLTVNRYYNSQNLTGGAAWSFSVGPDVALVASPADGSWIAQEPGGAQVPYIHTSTSQGKCYYAGTTYTSYYLTPPGADATLCAVASPGYELTSNSGQSSLVFGETANSGTKLSQQIDRNGETITYNYSTSGYLSSMTDTEGHVFTVTEDPTTHKINQIAGPTGATGAQYRTWAYSWASNGQLNYYTDPTGQITHYNYDGNGNLSKILSPGVYISGTLTVSEVDIAQTAAGQVTSVTRDDPSCPSGACTTTYTTAAAPQPVTSGANRCASYAVVGQSNVQPGTMVGCGTVTDPNGHKTSYGWDVSDQPVKTVDGLNQARAGIYNSDNQQTSGTDNSGNTATAAYDANNNQITATDAASASGQTGATANGVYSTPSTPAVTGPAGSSIPGNQYLPSSSTDPNSNCGTNAYDSNGNPTTVWSGLAGTGSPKSCTSPGGAPSGSQVKTTSTYTGDTGSTGCTGHNGQVCTSTNGNGGVTRYAYNTSGQLTTVTPPTPLHPTTITYDANGRRATVTDGAGRVTTYSYDADDRVTTTNINAAADPSCSTTTDCVLDYYDPDGNLILRNDGSGTTSKNYNLLNQLAAEYLPGLTGPWTCASFSDAGLHYTYDPAGILKSYCDQSGTVSYVYDADNHNTGVADPGGNCTPGAVVQPCTTFATARPGNGPGSLSPRPPG